MEAADAVLEQSISEPLLKTDLGIVL
jgi:hypothetical protein